MRRHPFLQQAQCYHTLGKLEEAEACYRMALEAGLDDSGLFNDLGVLLRKKGDLKGAASFLRKAIEKDPQNAKAYHNLGNVLNDQGKKEGAWRCYQKALELDGSEGEFFKAVGNLLRELGRREEALSLFEEAQKRFPEDPEISFGEGAVLKDLGRLEESVACYEEALAKNPDLAEGHYNLGNVFLKMNRLDEAERSFWAAIQKKPDFAEAYNNLGSTYKEKNDLLAAIRMFRRAAEVKGDLPEARWNLGLAHLLAGDFPAGWEGYERRWDKADYKKYRRDFKQPQWKGEDLQGKTILLHAEQGFGDAIQFVRYLPLVAALNGRVVLECPGPLKALFASVAGAEAVIGRGEPLPAFDLHCPLMSIPAVLRTELLTIPNRVPYLFPDSILVGKWRERMKAFGEGLRVGLVWAGNPEHLNDHNRSIPFDLLSPLLETRGVLFFSLQIGRRPVIEERTFPFVDLTDEIRDFSDTAALMENLDLVIAVDTAVAHLAGALAKRVWTLLPFSPDWRWLLDREDSPWYPTMRLYRQPTAGNWQVVLAKVKADLEALASTAEV
jgi:tetratricopeptide (TPR) repeat protein